MQRPLIVLLLSLTATGLTSAQSHDRHVREAFTAVAISAGGPLSPPVAAQLEMVIERWSTEAERQILLDALSRGQDAALEVMQGLEKVGHIRTPSSLAWDLRYAHQAPSEDGGRQLFLATDRPMSFSETVHKPRTSEYPFTLIELHVNDRGEGEGKLSRAMRVRTTGDGRFVTLENYETQPVDLTEVKQRR